MILDLCEQYAQAYSLSDIGIQMIVACCFSNAKHSRQLVAAQETWMFFCGRNRRSYAVARFDAFWNEIEKLSCVSWTSIS